MKFIYHLLQTQLVVKPDCYHYLNNVKLSSCQQINCKIIIYNILNFHIDIQFYNNIYSTRFLNYMYITYYSIIVLYITKQRLYKMYMYGIILNIYYFD